MTTKEAIEWTRIRLSNLRAEEMEKHSDTSPGCRSFYTQPNRDKDLAAIAVLSGLAEENERLTEKVVWFKNVNADWEAWAERSEKGRGILAEENAALKAEVERLDGAYKWLSQTNTELVEMREKAEAELERARPIIDAIMGAEEFGVNQHGLYHIWAFRHGQALLKACYDYREAKEKP